MLIVCVLSYFVKKINIKCRNHELPLLPIWRHFSLVLLEGEVTSPYCQGLAEPLSCPTTMQLVSAFASAT